MATNKHEIKRYASQGGKARAAKLDSQGASAQGVKAYLSGAVRTVVARWDELSDEQRQAISDRVTGGGN